MDRRYRRRQAGFILIWGMRTTVGHDGSTPVQSMCPVCQQQAMFRGRVARRWFTLFFIPVIPLGTVARFCECTSCGQQLNRTTGQLTQNGGLIVSDNAFAPREGPSGDNPVATAMRMHHDMLANPDDSGRLFKLVRHYLNMGEIADAKAACRAFPIAYQNDPAIEQTMRSAGVA